MAYLESTRRNPIHVADLGGQLQGSANGNSHLHPRHCQCGSPIALSARYALPRARKVVALVPLNRLLEPLTEGVLWLPPEFLLCSQSACIGVFDVPQPFVFKHCICTCARLISDDLEQRVYAGWFTVRDVIGARGVALCRSSVRSDHVGDVGKIPCLSPVPVYHRHLAPQKPRYEDGYNCPVP